MSHSNLAERIRNRSIHLAIIGQGYVGLPLAVEFARAGFAVIGIDTDLDRIGALQAGQSYTPDLESEDLIAVIRQGRYEATSDFSVLERIDVVLICVPTPLSPQREPDLQFVRNTARRAAAI